MVTKEQIERINELYKKKNEVGLTDEELTEQTTLRRLYIDSYKQSLRAQLDNIEVVTPEELKRRKEMEHVHGEGCGCDEHGHNHGAECNCGNHKHKH